MVADLERRVIWDEVSDMPPDIFLSIGTGLSANCESAELNGDLSPDPQHQGHLETLQNKRSASGLSYMWRVAHNIIDNQLNCENIWNKFKHHTEAAPTGKLCRPEDKQRNIRINVPFPGNRPALDNIDSVETMETQVARSVQTNPLILEVAHRLVASCFYFQKYGTSLHNRETGEYTCVGKHLTFIRFLR